MAKNIKTLISGNTLKAQVALWSAVTGEHQYTLAHELGISKSMLSQVVNGNKPDTKYREKIIKRTSIGGNYE